MTVSDLVRFWLGLEIAESKYIARFVTWKIPSNIRTWGTVEKKSSQNLKITRPEGNILTNTTMVYDAIRKIGVIAKNYISPTSFVYQPVEAFLKTHFKAYTQKVKDSDDRDYFNFLHLSFGILNILLTQGQIPDYPLIFFTREEYLTSPELENKQLANSVLTTRYKPVPVTGIDSILFYPIDIPVISAAYTDMGCEHFKVVYAADDYYCCSGIIEINDNFVFVFLTLHRCSSDERTALQIKNCLLPFLLTELRKD